MPIAPLVSKLRRHRVVAAGAALGGAAIAIGALAGGAGGAVERSLIPRGASEARTEMTGAGSAVAHCPGGKVVSGGFSAPGFSKQTSPAVRIASTAFGRRAWGVEGIVFGDGGDGGGPGGQDPAPAPTGTVAAHAYCAPSPGRITARQASVAVTANTIASATATCARRERVIGGGFSSPDFDLAAGRAALALGSRRTSGRAWTVEGVTANGGDAPPGATATLLATAYCVRNGPKLIERSRQADVGGEQLRTVDVSCPSRTRAVSGGFAANAAVSPTGLAAAGAVESYRLPRGAGWTTSAVTTDDDLAATLTAYVYCLSKRA